MIDWEKHWERHALGFVDGYLVLNIQGVSYRLKPGAGFGDLSHETTRLVLKLMPPLVSGRNVFDVGCGSGILTIAAIGMGALHTWAIDIDPEALTHTKANISLNKLDSQATVVSTLPQVSSPIALMNMIWSEQKEAIPLVDELVTSGILKEHEKPYLDWIESLGYRVMRREEEGQWCAFYVKKGS